VKIGIITVENIKFQVWLREQILHGGGPEWLDMDQDNIAGNGIGGAAAPVAAQGGVGGFLFGAAGEPMAVLSNVYYCLNCNLN